MNPGQSMQVYKQNAKRILLLVFLILIMEISSSIRNESIEMYGSKVEIQ